MEIRRVHRRDADYPGALDCLGEQAPKTIEFLGTQPVPERPILGLICSVSCPGSVIIKIYDAVRALRDAGVVVCGGFHSPMEQECLHFLVRGRQSVVLCAATGLMHVTINDQAQPAFHDGRLVVLSPFGDEVERATPWHGSYRNGVVAALSDVLLVPHADPKGKVFVNAKQAIDRGQTVLTFDDGANRHLIDTGAHPINVEGLVTYAGQLRVEAASARSGSHFGHF